MMGQRTSKPVRYDTLRDARLLSAGAVLRRFGLNVLYTLWLVVITYISNVLFNFAALVWHNGLGALFQWSYDSHALLIDQTAALLFAVPVYVMPLVLAGVLSANLLWAVRAAYKRERQGVTEIDKEIKALTTRISAYNSKYGWHPLRDRIIPALRRRPQRQRPVPTEEEQIQHKANERQLNDLQTKRASIDKSSQLEHYDQIVTWLNDDPELVELTDDLIRRKHFFRDMREATFVPVAVILVSRLLGTWAIR
jgi:hypothetical protein